jgi:hypothetical protein
MNDPGRTSSMPLLFAVVSFAGFCAALAAHVATLRGIDVLALVPQVFLLQVGIFVLVIPVAIFARKNRRRTRIDGSRSSSRWQSFGDAKPRSSISRAKADASIRDVRKRSR